MNGKWTGHNSSRFFTATVPVVLPKLILVGKKRKNSSCPLSSFSLRVSLGNGQRYSVLPFLKHKETTASFIISTFFQDWTTETAAMWSFYLQNAELECSTLVIPNASIWYGHHLAAAGSQQFSALMGICWTRISQWSSRLGNLQKKVPLSNSM